MKVMEEIKMSAHDIYLFKWREMYTLYIAKAARKGKTADEVDEIICWLTGYTKDQLQTIDENTNMTEFFESAPNPNPNRILIKGSICGVKIQEIEEIIMKEIRYLDKLIDELAKGKTMDKIFRK